MAAKLANPTESTSRQVGAVLAAAREQRGIPLEMAAHDTRIRVPRLQDIENGDFNHFAHPSYARMFLIDYAKYLGIPLNRIKDLLPESVKNSRVECSEYLQRIPDNFVAPMKIDKPRKRVMPALVTLITLSLLSVGGFEVWLFLKNINRIGYGRTASAPEAVVNAASDHDALATDIPAAPVVATVKDQPVQVVEAVQATEVVEKIKALENMPEKVEQSLPLAAPDHTELMRLEDPVGHAPHEAEPAAIFSPSPLSLRGEQTLYVEQVVDGPGSLR